MAFNGFNKGDFLSCNGTRAGAQRLARRMEQLSEFLAPEVLQLDHRLVPVVSPAFTERHFRLNPDRPRDHACLVFVDRSMKRSRLPRVPQLGIYLHSDGLAVGLSSGLWPAGRLRQILKTYRRQFRSLSRFQAFGGDVILRTPVGSKPWRSGLVEHLDRIFFVGKVFPAEDHKSAIPDVSEEALLIFRDLLPTFRLLNQQRVGLAHSPLPPLHSNIDNEDSVEISFKGESELLHDLWKFLGNRDFQIDFPMLLNIYLAIKTKPFVLLSGISGTGKSLLVRLLSEGINGMGCDSAPRGFQLIPVRADWQDRKDLFGFSNLLTGRFEVGDLLSSILKAELEPERPFFVCLDEMNLARVEYYFADMLSLMETGRRGEAGRWIFDPLPLFSEPNLLHPSTDDNTKLPSRQVLPDNLFILGTVNVDESTVPFSRKVLDRANTVEFSAVDLHLPIESPLPFQVDLDELNRLGSALLFRPFRKLSDIRDNHPARKWNNPLIEINTLLAAYDLQFGYRVRDEILVYMAYAIDLLETFPHALKTSLKPSFDENIAFDFQIIQKILPRISGPSELLDDLLQNFFIYCQGKYLKSECKIQYMIKKLHRTGDTSFWSG